MNQSPRRGGGGVEAAQRAAAGPGAAEQRGGAVPATSGVHTLQRPGPGDLARRDGAVSRGVGAPSPPAGGLRGSRGRGRLGGGAGPPPLHRTYLWNVLALTEQRRRRTQATLGPSARPPRQAAQPIGWRSVRARSSLACIPCQSRLFPTPSASGGSTHRLSSLPPPPTVPVPSPPLRSQTPSRSRESGQGGWGPVAALCFVGLRAAR